MSTSHGKGKGREERSIWSQWSEWSDFTWDADRRCWYSYRSRTHRVTGKYDYQESYQETQAGSGTTEDTVQTPQGQNYSSSPEYILSNQGSSAPNYNATPDPRTSYFPDASSNYPASSSAPYYPSTFSTPKASYPSSSPDPYSSYDNKDEYAKYGSSAGESSSTGLERQFQKTSLLERPIYEDEVAGQTPKARGQKETPRVIYREGNIDKSGISPNTDLNPRYRVVSPKNYDAFWKLGRVFQMLWTEPTRPANRKDTANGGSQISYVWLGGTVYSEIRRFVVVSNNYGFCLCLAIHTYGGQATLKERLPDPENHAIIYTSSKPPPTHRIGNLVEDLQHVPIRVVPDGPTLDESFLDPKSRLHYGKVYTVEKDVRILNIGMVHKGSLTDLTECSPVKNKSNEYKKKKGKN